MHDRSGLEERQRVQRVTSSHEKDEDLKKERAELEGPTEVAAEESSSLAHELDPSKHDALREFVNAHPYRVSTREGRIFPQRVRPRPAHSIDL